jgi:hypothetical protein
MDPFDHAFEELGESVQHDEIDVFDAIAEVESSDLYAGLQPVSFGLAMDAISRSQQRAPSEAIAVVRNAFRNGAPWAVLAANMNKTG